MHAIITFTSIALLQLSGPRLCFDERGLHWTGSLHSGCPDVRNAPHTFPETQVVVVVSPHLLRLAVQIDLGVKVW